VPSKSAVVPSGRLSVGSVGGRVDALWRLRCGVVWCGGWRQSGQPRDAATLGTLCEFTCEWFRKQSEDVLMQLSAVLQV